LDPISGLSLYILNSLERNHIMNQQQLIELVGGDPSPFVHELLDAGYISKSDGGTVGAVIRIEPRGRAYCESCRKQAADELKTDKHRTATRIFAAIGAATGVASLIWHILNSLLQQAVK
jgi:hypothetical protein